MCEAILEMRGITKSFPGVKALSQVNLTLNKGEVLALIGENGAGKSTLMKCLIASSCRMAAAALSGQHNTSKIHRHKKTRRSGFFRKLFSAGAEAN